MMPCDTNSGASRGSRGQNQETSVGDLMIFDKRIEIILGLGEVY